MTAATSHGDGKLSLSFRAAIRAPLNGYDSCAVVGSSGTLLTDRLGEDIDEYDFVIRFNGAPTESYEPIAGSKTSLSFLNTQAMGEILQRCAANGECNANPQCCPRDQFVILNSNSAVITRCYQRVCGGVSRHATGLDGSPLITRAQSALKKANVMSGMYGIAAAALVCNKRVSVFGFTTSSSGQGAITQYHYYDRCGPDTRADSISRSASSIDIIVNAATAVHRGGPAIRLVPASGHHPDYRAPPSTRCPAAHEFNTRIGSRLQNKEFLAPHIDVPGSRLPSARSVARSLRVGASPYVVLHGYWNRSLAHAVREEVVAALAECSETGEGMDRRRLGASSPYALSRRFQEDPYLLEIARQHLPGKHVNVKAQAGLTLAGEASGGGWHKDTLARGIKALLYLDDVDSTNGPFTMLLDYEDKMLTWSPDAVSGIRRRLNASAVDRACVEHRAHVRELHAEMGSVVVFEISNAHRGKPSTRGERASLTNYYKVSKASTVCRVGEHVTQGPFVRGV